MRLSLLLLLLPLTTSAGYEVTGRASPGQVVFAESLNTIATTTADREGSYNFYLEEGFYVVYAQDGNSCYLALPDTNSRLADEPRDCNMEVTKLENANDLHLPLVLEESMTCEPYLTDNLVIGADNNGFEVLKLQLFLTWYGFYTPLTGVFDELVAGQVKSFQWQERTQIAEPSLQQGFPTGNVREYTREFINSYICTGLTFPEDSAITSK